MRKGLFRLALTGQALAAALMIVGDASGQDPGNPDQLLFGNLDGSPVAVELGQDIVIPVWVKTDDSVSSVHIPLSSDDSFVTARNGGSCLPEYFSWCDFLDPVPDNPQPGWTNQSLVGNSDGLYTDYQWAHVADLYMRTTADSSVLGDTACAFMEGFDPLMGGLVFVLADGITQIVPVATYPCLYFPENFPPQFSEPNDGEVFNINQGFEFQFDVVATDTEGDTVGITLDLEGLSYEFYPLETDPGYSRYHFVFTPAEGDSGSYAATFTADDGHGGLAELHITIDITPAILSVGQMAGLPGFTVSVPINLFNQGISSWVGGFEVRLQYNEMITHFVSGHRGQRIDGWQYFNVTEGDSSTLRVVGLADFTEDGPSLPPGMGPIAWLTFQVDPDDVFIGQYAFIDFLVRDYSDNTLADTTGYVLIHPALDDGWIFIMDPDDILVGDINLNGFAWEVSDAILFVNHLVYPTLFPFGPAQDLASDTNGDGVPGTLPDLIYLINVLNGIIPPPKMVYTDADVAVISIAQSGEAGTLRFSYQSEIPAGGVLLRVDHGRTGLENLTPLVDMSVLSNDEDGILTVLVYDLQGKYISPGEDLFDLKLASESPSLTISELQVSDRYGNFIPAETRFESDLPQSFRLYGSYPNPFNSSTTIRFSLPVAGNVQLAIYNITGQLVKSLKLDGQPAGDASIIWDGTNSSGLSVASGVYFYRIQAGRFSATSRMTLLK